MFLFIRCLSVEGSWRQSTLQSYMSYKSSLHRQNKDPETFVLRLLRPFIQPCMKAATFATMQADIKSGQADLCQACRQSLAHGVLLALRYLAPLLPWQGPGVDQGQDAALRPWLQGLLQLLEEATDLVLQPLSKPQDSNIGA